MVKQPRHPSILQRLAGCLLPLVVAAVPVAQAELSVTHGSQSLGGQPSGTTEPEWLYTLGPDDSLGEVASTLLAKPYNAERLLSYNGINSRSAISDGDTLRIPLSWLQRQPNPARAISVSGQVQWLSGASGRKQALTNDTLIRVGDEIISHSGSAAIELADGSRIRVSPGSRLIFNRLTQYGKAGMVDTRLRLDRGEVQTHVKPIMDRGSRFEIETPSAVAAVRGTMFTLQASPGKSSVQVTEGTVAFGPRGQTRDIPAGYSASVDLSSPGTLGALAIRRLPPAPKPNPLPPKVNRLPVALSWQPSQAPAHRVDVFDADSGRWVNSEEVTGDSYQLDLLDNGRYEIQLAALNSLGVAGMPSSLEVDIDLQARAARLLSPAEGAGVNNDMPEFSWRYQGENEVGRVEIAESDDFREVIATSEWAPDNTALPSRPLSPGQYYWRVVTEAGGNSVASSGPRTLVVNGTLPPVRIISVNYVDSQVRVFWERVDTATDYLLQLSEEPNFENIIKEATVSDTTAALRLIPGRRYFVRLKALSDGPLASRWGPGRELYLE